MEERFLDDDELDLWIQAADAVLAPYRSAASSSVVARARLLGTRVVATAVGGLPEQLGSGDILVATDDELTKALSDLASASSAAVSA
jgi:glycosyltransferase involved in cell wall biosynthesis